MTDADTLRAKFLDELAQSGTVSDPEWLAAFRDIPRDAFVPYYFTQTPEQPGWRLQALDVHQGHRVLEVGTGTGYNAALLCHRLGPANVTSINIDPGLVDRARERLAAFDYFPHVEATDGVAGCPGCAPFDRIIASVGMARVPGAWIDQTAPGGKILVPLDLAGRAGLLALLTVYADGKAEGPFLPDFGGFMPLRANQHRANDVLSTVGDDDGDTRETTLPVAVATSPAAAVGGHRNGASRMATTRPARPATVRADRPQRAAHGVAGPPRGAAPMGPERLGPRRRRSVERGRGWLLVPSPPCS